MNIGDVEIYLGPIDYHHQTYFAIIGEIKLRYLVDNHFVLNRAILSHS